MKHSVLLTTLCLLALNVQIPAQNSVQMPDPLASLKRSERNKLKEQAAGFFNSAKPAVATAAKSTVAVSYRNNRISFGTIVTSPRTKQSTILTKWSEIVDARSRLIVTTHDGKTFPAQVVGVYPDHDLALLTVEAGDTKLIPLDLNNPASPELGNFIALARPDGNVESFGVVSVKARSLRESDKAYLGVMMDFASAGKDGVPLKQVMPDSAASKAGLKDGDIIISVDEVTITGAMEMRNLLQRLVPGSKIVINYRRGVVEKNTTVHLGSRADSLDIRRVPRDRMEKMEKMGTTPSPVRFDFPSIIQSDMPIQDDQTPDDQTDNYTNDCGGPVADLDGNIVGIVIARGSRIKTFIIPTTTIQQVLATKPQYASDALANNARRQTRKGSRNSRRSGRNNTSEGHSSGTSRAVPANEDETMDNVRRLLDQTKQNNDENAENLRKIEEALRGLKENKR